MTYARPYDREPLGHAMNVDYAYRNPAERSIDQVELATVCEQPEPLRGGWPGIEPDYRLRPVNRGFPYNPLAIYSGDGFTARVPSEDSLLMKVIEAYQILDEIFAPYPVMPARPATAMNPRRPPFSGEDLP